MRAEHQARQAGRSALITAADVADRIEMRAHAGLAQSLADCGVERERLGELAAAATREWTGGFNPRAVTESDLLELYRAAY